MDCPEPLLDTHFQIVRHSHGFDLIGSLRSLTWNEDKYDPWKEHEGNLKWMALIFLFQDLIIDYNGDKEAMLHYLAEFEDVPVLSPDQCDCDDCRRMRQKEDDEPDP